MSALGVSAVFVTTINTLCGRFKQAQLTGTPRMSKAETSALCTKCGKKGAKKSYRLNPRNWHQEYRLLCTPCRKRFHYAEVNFGRPYSETKSAVRPWGMNE
jgi:hypothetical protein